MNDVADEIADYLELLGLGTKGTNLFTGYKPDVDNSTFIINTGGFAPENWGEVFNPKFQIFIVANSFEEGQAKYNEINNALSSIRNETLSVNCNYYFFILQLSGGHLGRDENGKELFSINYLCKIRQSVYIPQIQTGNPIGLLLALTYQL